MSYAILDIELREPLPPVALADEQHGFGALIRLDGRPLGYLLHELEPGGELAPQALGGIIAAELRNELVAAALEAELRPPERIRPVELSICVQLGESPADPQERLRELALLPAADLLLIVRRHDHPVAELASRDTRIRAIAMPGADLGVVADRILAEARSDHVAFLEEGTLPDDGWSAGVAGAFARHPGAALVTGPLLARELRTQAQIAWARDPGRRRLLPGKWAGDPLTGSGLNPLELGFDPGLSNVVLERRAVLGQGGFGVAADLPRRLLRAGFAIVHEPRALAFVTPERDRDAQRRRHRAWGAGVAAAAAAAFRESPGERRALVGLSCRWLWHRARRLGGPGRGEEASELTAAELSGAWERLTRGLMRGLARRVGAEGSAAVRDCRTGQLAPPARRPDPYAPTQVRNVDLARGPADDLAQATPALLVAWWRDLPLGHRERAASEDPISGLARALAPAVGDRLFPTGFEMMAPGRVPRPPGPPPPLRELVDLRTPLQRLDATPPPTPSPEAASVSVIVCTRRRPAHLRRCLEGLTELAAPPAEIIVVSNDEHDAVTPGVVERFPGVTLVTEPRPGLSAARNTGVRVAAGEVLAFIDDDTIVHRLWLQRLLAGFCGPEVLAVTGSVLPAELATREQVIFEKMTGHLSRGFRRIVFDRTFFESQLDDGVPVWSIGAGANMALRRAAFQRAGLFDERLGAGAAGCSEDSELWYRVLAAGAECRYEPEAVVFHHHRADGAQLRRQLHDYMRGHVAALFVQYARHGHRGNLRRAFRTVPAHLLRNTLRELMLPPEGRARVLTAELSGYLAGLASWRLALSSPAEAGCAAGAPPPHARSAQRPGAAPPGSVARAPLGAG